MSDLILTPGCCYRVAQINYAVKGAYRRRLLAMGLTPGVLIYVKRIAPFGDPILFDLNGFSLSLRRHELQEFLKLEQLNG